MKKPVVGVIVVAVVVALIVWGLVTRPQKPVISTQPLVKLNEIPKALTDIFDFGDVKPYNIQEADFPGGTKQYILSFQTGHLRENYNAIKEDAGKHGFKLQTDVFDVKNFTFVLSFAKNDDKLLADSVLRGTGAGHGVITIILYTRI